VKEILSFSVTQGRRSKRILSKGRTSLVINLDRNQKRLPLVLSERGYVLNSFQREQESHIYERICAEHSAVSSQ